ncbi:MAG: type II toxin-antitoxin system RelE/ParE family toxin [Verrucomicrobiae bacterium]|nr:type II toxin-antitoxin system RelE/ParE family toxin [Verrucomicrobiae bacterium]
MGGRQFSFAQRRLQILDVWGEEQAERYVRMISDDFAELACDPERGRPCDNIREGYRRRRVEHHVIFYRVVDVGVDIVRVLHEQMDFPRHL